MNLSEQLTYCNTDILLEINQKHLDSVAKYPEQFPGMELTIWQTAESPYYKTLLDLKKRQDAGEKIPDEDYRAVPLCGMAYYWSAAEGYYMVNFHYNFYTPKYIGREALLYKFMDFLAVINFMECRESEVYNWATTFKSFAEQLREHRPDLVDKCEFVNQILEAVDPMKKNGIGSLLNIDRNIAPDIFDNAAKYFRLKESYYKYLEDKYAKSPSLKAADVLEILEISRRTLTRYVKENKVLIDSNINGRYRYNKASVFALLKGDKVNC